MESGFRPSCNSDSVSVGGDPMNIYASCYKAARVNGQQIPRVFMLTMYNTQSIFGHLTNKYAWNSSQGRRAF